jgi:hypothetical protein
MNRPAIKILVFVVLLGLFYAWGGFTLPSGAFNTPISSKHNPVIPWGMIILCFVSGATIAVWGDRTVGTIHPISFRSGYIILGALMMMVALLLTSCGRIADSRRPDKSPEAAAVGAVNFAVAVPATVRRWFSSLGVVKYDTTP